MNRPIFFLAVLTCLNCSELEGVERSRINKSAQALARLLTPTPPASKGKTGDISRISKQMISVIESIETSYRSNGPAPVSLVEKALDFRVDMQDYEKLMVTNAVVTAWREANGRGLFDKDGNFQEKITKGRGVGQKCTFELIVPAEVFPEASNQLANLRLVTVEKQRADGAGDELSTREDAFRAQLVKMIDEKKSGARLAKFEKGEKTNSLGLTEDQALALWERDMELAGEASQQKPTIRLDGGISGTPSHMTKDRWRLTMNVTNLSRHPTEVVLEIHLLGITDEKRDYYLMAKSSETLRLRTNESVSKEFFTRTQSSYKTKADDHDEIPKKERRFSKVRCRGFVAVVKHGDKVVSFTGSDQLLTRYADPAEKDLSVSSLPVF